MLQSPVYLESMETGAGALQIAEPEMGLRLASVALRRDLKAQLRSPLGHFRELLSKLFLGARA